VVVVNLLLFLVLWLIDIQLGVDQILSAAGGGKKFSSPQAIQI